MLLSCNIQYKHRLDNLIVYEKNYSSDSTKYLIRFSYDEGAFGSCCNQTSILKITDSLTSLNDFIIPSVFDNPTWVNENEVKVDIHMFQLLRARGNFDPALPDLKIDKINDVSLRKNYINLITENDQEMIKFSRISPNDKFVLIGYEYESNVNLEDSVLHISVIPKGEKIPNYGNLYIVTSRMYNQIDSIDWITNDSINVKIREKDKNYGQIESCEIYKTTSYPEIIKNIKKVITYE